MRKRAVIVALVGALLSCSQAADAECSRGAACLGGWHKPRLPPPNPVEQPPEEAPVTGPTVLRSPAAEWKNIPTLAPDPTTRRYPPGQRSWYGWQLLIIDGAVLATLAAAEAAQVRGDGATALGLSLGLVFDIAPPIVHAFHHRSGIAWASFGVRSTLPAAFLISTLLIQSCSGPAGGPFDNHCLGTTAANTSALLGIAAASALDASLFAWEGPTNHKPSRATLEWNPILAPRTNGATVGIGGAF